MEVMIVGAIISTLAAIAIPNYLRWNAQYKLKQEMTTLMSNLNLARMIAINRNVAVTVTLANGITDPADGAQKVTASFAPAVIPDQRMGKAGVVTLANTTPSGNLPMTITFNSLGTQLGGAQTFTLTNRDGVVYSARVMPTGKVTWCPKSTCP